MPRPQSVVCSQGRQGEEGFTAPRFEGCLVEIRNPFNVLEGVVEKEVDVAGADREREESPDAVTLPQGRILMVGMAKLNI